MDKEQLDILKKVEDLTAKLNQSFKEKGESVFSRYPLTFALLVVLGATMFSQGMKELLLEVPVFKNQPLTMLIMGIVILVITGTLYKKLKK